VAALVSSAGFSAMDTASRSALVPLSVVALLSELSGLFKLMLLELSRKTVDWVLTVAARQSLNVRASASPDSLDAHPALSPLVSRRLRLRMVVLGWDVLFPWRLNRLRVFLTNG